MISSDVMRGYNDLLILYMLLENASYGYEISKNIKEQTDGKYVIKETTLYSAFNRLKKQRYIDSFSKDETFGKKRTYYRITEDGRNYYQEKCHEWLLTKTVIDRFVHEEEK